MWEKNSRCTNIFLMDEVDIETMATEYSIGLNIPKFCLTKDINYNNPSTWIYTTENMWLILLLLGDQIKKGSYLIVSLHGRCLNSRFRTA